MDAAGQGRLGQAQGGGGAQQTGVLADGFYYAEMAKLEPLIEVTVHPFRLYIRILWIAHRRQVVSGSAAKHVRAPGVVKTV
jgi:hypothetical protein